MHEPSFLTIVEEMLTETLETVCPTLTMPSCKVDDFGYEDTARN